MFLIQMMVVVLMIRAVVELQLCLVRCRIVQQQRPPHRQTAPHRRVRRRLRLHRC